METLWTGRAPGMGFAAPVRFEDDDGTVKEFSSVTAIHDFEAQAAREVASGDRARPVVFREFSQDQSNRDCNVFQDRHPQVTREKLRAASRRRGKKIIDVGAVEVSVTEGMPEGGE